MKSLPFKDVTVFDRLRQKIGSRQIFERPGNKTVELNGADYEQLANRIAFSTGNHYYVDSVNGGDGYPGTKDLPKATIDAAVNLCSALSYDTVVVLPGHTETITTDSGIDLDVANVRLVGLGRGRTQAQVKFNNAAATIQVNAANVSISGMRFTSTITVVAVGIDVIAAATDCEIDSCVFDVETAATDEFVIGARFAAGADYGTFTNNFVDQDLGGALCAVQVIDCDRMKITGNEILGDYSTANIVGLTTLSTNIHFGNNLLVNGEGGALNAQPCIEMLTGTTGLIYNNYCVCNLATKVASIVSATSLLFENYYNEDIQGTGGLIGTVSADD